jgi:hypothetical protein
MGNSSGGPGTREGMDSLSADVSHRHILRLEGATEKFLHLLHRRHLCPCVP